MIFVLPKAIVFLWPFVAGWIISMMAHPVIEYLEKKVKLPKKFGSAILIAAVITGIIVVLYFAVRGIALQVIGFIQDAPDIRHEIMRQGMIFQKKIEQIFKYSSTIFLENSLISGADRSEIFSRKRHLLQEIMG